MQNPNEIEQVSTNSPTNVTTSNENSPPPSADVIQLHGKSTGRIDPKLLTVPGAPEGGKEGKGGILTPSATFTLSNRAFLDALFRQLPEDARPVVTCKPGDPQIGGWSPSDAGFTDVLCPPDKNNYFNCASILPAQDGELNARKESAAAYHVLVLDDVGTKVDRGLLGDAAPTWVLETSPGNFQIGFCLDPPLTEPAAVELLQQQIAAAGLTDKGALGMVRWVRLPIGVYG
jgi:hypothetical protein